MTDRFDPNVPEIFNRLGQSGAAKERMMVAARHLMADQSGHVLVGHFPSVEPLGHLVHDHHKGVVKIASLAGIAGLTVTLAVSADRPVVDAQTAASPDNSQNNTLLVDIDVPAGIPQPDGSELRIVDQRSTPNGPKLPESEPKTVVQSVSDQTRDEKPNTEGPNEPTDVISGGGPVDQEPTVVREYSQKNPDGSVVLVKEWTNGEFTTEILEAAPAPPKIVKEVARTFPEERPDGSVWLVVQYSDGSFGRDMISGPTKQVQSPAQPPVSAPPASTTASGLVKSGESCAAPYADRGPARKEYPPFSKGEGITDSPPGVNPPVKILRGKIEQIGRLENGQVGIVLKIHGQLFNIEVITKETADTLGKQGKKLQPTTMFYQNSQNRTDSKSVPMTLCQIEAVLKEGDAIYLNVEKAKFEAEETVFGFGLPTRAIFFYI